MTSELERLEAEALKLPVEERERLIEMLIDSLGQADTTTDGKFGGFASAELQKYWLAEAERRMQLLREGRTRTYSADEVITEARARLKAVREIR